MNRALDREAHNNTTLRIFSTCRFFIILSLSDFVGEESNRYRYIHNKSRSIQGHENKGFWFREFLKVLAQSLNLFDEEVNICKCSSWVGDDHAEEVDLVSLRLIAHHGRSVLHHSGFDDRGHLQQKEKSF